MFTIKQINNLKNKVILLRGDLDVPIKNGKIIDNFRLSKMLPTIEYLSRKGAKMVIMGHLGRPSGRMDENLSMAPVTGELRKLLHINRKEIGNLKLEIGGFLGFFIGANICLLENLRFCEEEEKNDLKFAEKLASLGDIFVNDAFANSHRKHSSIVSIPKFMPSFAGLHFMEELKALSKSMDNPKRPVVAILGGAKLETKLPLIKKLAKKFDYVLVGGKLSLEIEKLFACAGSQIKKLSKNIILPIDYAGKEKLDIGKRTIKLYAEILKKAKMIVWNGPMGKYEDKRYIKGTFAIANAVASSKAYAVVGGGDIIAALGEVRMLDKMDFVSTGGGAMLEFLEKGTLAGIEALENQK